MTRLLGMLAALLIVAAVIGYFRGWFHAEAQNVDGWRTVTLTMDKDKIDQDKAHVQQKVHDLQHK